MFGKKKNGKIKVCHYEGLDDFMQNYPCEIQIIGDIFEIKRLKPETVVTLSMEKIIKFDAMSEEQFMSKYHNCKIEGQSKSPKTFLVVTYKAKDDTIKYLAFWGVLFDGMKLIDIAYKNVKNSESYSL